jgi:MFS family permease
MANRAAVPALVVFGRLSDRFGRKPVILGGLAAGCVGLVLVATAHGTAWLFAACAVQGLAIGMISGAPTATLVELDPGGAEGRPAMLAGLAQAGGSGLGPLLAGLLAQWAVAPLHLRAGRVAAARAGPAARADDRPRRRSRRGSDPLSTCGGSGLQLAGWRLMRPVRRATGTGC